MANIFKRAWAAYNAAIVNRPVLVPALSTGVLMGTGDLLAQSIERRRSAGGSSGVAKELRAFDLRRTGRLFVLGCCVYGPFLNLWYKFLAVRFHGQRYYGLLKMVAADQLIVAPCFIVSYLTVVTYLHTGDTNQVGAQLAKFPDVLLNNYKVWPAAQTLNFLFVPVHLRIMFANSVALLWNTYLSWVTHQTESESES